MLDYDSQLIRDSFEGRLAKILSVSDDQRILYLRLENGTTTRITADDPLSFDYQKGKVIIWTDDSIAIVPDELWVENHPYRCYPQSSQREARYRIQHWTQNDFSPQY